jgi:aldose 1-epimerase
MYFNLDGTKDISDHALDIACDHVILVDATGIPTGEIQSVIGSDFDFRRARPAHDMPLDHNFCTRDPGFLHRNARLRAGNGRELVVYSDQPGLQVFNAAQMDTDVPGHLGHSNGNYCGVAFEPQIWPDAPNQAGFPEAVLRPGETYSSHSLFVFE